MKWILLILCLTGLFSCAANDPAHCKRPKQASSRALYKH